MLPLCRSKFGRLIPSSVMASQPTDCIAEQNPVTPTIRSNNAVVTPQALPSVVCWSNQRQMRKSLPTARSVSSHPILAVIASTSAFSGVQASIFSHSPAMLRRFPIPVGSSQHAAP